MSKKSFLSWILVFCIILTQCLPLASAYATDIELMITGSGVNNDVVITAVDWSKYNVVERFYSTNNSLGFHKIVKAKGYDLFELIGEDNIKSGSDYNVKFTCSDGFEFTRLLSELKNANYYSNFTDESKTIVLPMIAKYTSVLADFPKDVFAPPINFTDKEITEADSDSGFPKLVFGQISIDDMNMSKWGKEIVKITVGEEDKKSSLSDSNYKHISFEGEPYNVDAITGATFTIEGPGVKGYRAISLRQIEEDTEEQVQNKYYERMNGKIIENSYEGINAKYLIDNYVDAKENAGNIIFKDKSRKTITTVPIGEASKYVVAYGINEIPLVYLDTEEGYVANKFNDNGCFKLVYNQNKAGAKEFSNVAYIYVEEKDAKNIYEHTYAPYDNKKYTDYEIIIHGDAIGKEVRYKLSEIEAMTNLHYTDEYSLSNSEYFWYYNTYKGVPLWDMLLKAGLDPKIDENTPVRFIAADNYNFAPMTIKEIKDNSLYGYYEKSALDMGDGTFPGEYVDPIKTGMPVLVAYGFNSYPYVTRPIDEGYNSGLGNDGGPIRIIFGKTNYNDTNGSNQVQFAKEIIIGEGDSVISEGLNSGEGEMTQIDVDKNSSWNHNQSVYTEYLDKPVLRVTGSQVKEPMTFTLRQIEELTDYAIRDIYTGDGVREFEGIVLWDLISKVVGLKEDVEVPSVRVFSGQNYNQILRSNDQLVNGVKNSQGQIKDIIIAYAVEGYPLVANEGDIGYANNNAHGPLRLILEESKSMWVKWTDCIVVGTGDYEAPDIKDVKTGSVFNDIDNHWAKSEISTMSNKGYVNGNNGMFRPNDSITRAEFVSMMVRILDIESENANSSFIDVNSSDWFAPNVLAAVKNGMVKGYEDNTFRPHDPITRQEIGTIIGSILNENISDAQISEILSVYNDEVAGWAKVNVAISVKAGIIQGLPGNEFGGDQNATRAQAAVMLLRYLNK